MTSYVYQNDIRVKSSHGAGRARTLDLRCIVRYGSFVRFDSDTARKHGLNRWAGKSQAERSAYMSALASIPRPRGRGKSRMYMRLRVEVELLKTMVLEMREALSVNDKASQSGVNVRNLDK